MLANSKALFLKLAVVTREAQLQTLRAQLNPHFYFNCLNSLRHLIASNPDRALTMVTNLADLMRYSLTADTRDTVTLAEELEVVDHYLDLERVRLEERLKIERVVSPAALSARIPTMLVLTLVENAIKHGVSELTAGGFVRIEASRTGDDLTVTVTNSGRLKSATSEAGHGLFNARERLRLLYSGAGSLDLSGSGDVTIAALRLPFSGELRHERAAG